MLHENNRTGPRFSYRSRRSAVPKAAEYLRLLVVGATAVMRMVRNDASRQLWMASLLDRKPTKIATVGLANKAARNAWAGIDTKGGRRSPYRGTTILSRRAIATGLGEREVSTAIMMKRSDRGVVQPRGHSAEGAITRLGSRPADFIRDNRHVVLLKQAEHMDAPDRNHQLRKPLRRNRPYMDLKRHYHRTATLI